MTIILCTGGRTFSDATRVGWHLEGALRQFGPDTLFVQGGARGADQLVREWCARKGMPCCTFHAQWDALGKAAGHRRNGWMLTFFKPDYCLFFPGGYGTANMVHQAQQAGVTCLAG